MKFRWVKFHVLFFTLTWIFNYVFNFYHNIPDGKLMSYSIFFISENIILIGYFYCNMYLSRFVLKKMGYLIPFLLAFSMLGSFPLALNPYIFYDHQGRALNFSHVYFFKLFEVSYITVSSIGFLFLRKWDESSNQKLQLTESHSEAELTFLRSQMSPHFLLNTLNSLYSLALNKSPNTYSAIAELKKIYSYIQKSEGKASLKNEIEYLENFIRMQKRRFSSIVDVKTVFTLDRDYEIEPLMLISFIENAFKHGVSMKERSFIHIRFQVIKGRLEYAVLNSDHSSKYMDATSGIGLQNLNRRLELLYRDKYMLEYFREGKTFNSLLVIAQL